MIEWSDGCEETAWVHVNRANDRVALIGVLAATAVASFNKQTYATKWAEIDNNVKRMIFNFEDFAKRATVVSADGTDESNYFALNTSRASGWAPAYNSCRGGACAAPGNFDTRHVEGFKI